MQDLDRALNDINVIREQLARTRVFRGYGSATLAATGALALSVAGMQSLWLKEPSIHVYAYISTWIATAAFSVVLIGIEATARARRAYGSLAASMLQSAVEQFLPAIVAGALLTAVVLQCAPQCASMVPGLWQVIFSLGAFATSRILPGPMVVVGIWYLVCGLTCLELGQTGHAYSPWAMGLPFGVGQLLVACILQLNREVSDE